MKAYIVLGCGKTPEQLAIYQKRVEKALSKANPYDDLLIFCGQPEEHRLAGELAKGIKNLEFITELTTFHEIKAAKPLIPDGIEVTVCSEIPHIILAKYIAMLEFREASYLSPFTSKSLVYWTREAASFVVTALRFIKDFKSLEFISQDVRDSSIQQ